ncbi:MAG TPA: phenylalanine--tRNA ligase subunit beta [Acidimicrobiales bacterium]|nr:phenylalanine--tRNA ligase subunit beta [Acidimicrobiales bacterium]
MLVPLSWLRDFAPIPDDVDALVDACNSLGLVVEGVASVGAGVRDVVVAKVLSVDPIEGADKIRRIVVDHGDGPVQVVCGAWNFAAGATVAFAPVGAVLPGDFAIGKRKMKGVESNGMICSERELELGDEGGGIMVLDDAIGAGTPLSEALGITPDVVLDLAIEGNRPDALCILGIARDLAAKLDIAFTEPEAAIALPAPSDAGPPVSVESPALCPVFTATRLEGVTVGASPEWMQRRLTLAGMRPISNVVDISNYVMLEHGQPTHPYDAARLPGGGFIVRAAEPGEKLLTLDGETRKLGLGGEDCVIADANGTGVGIGGIMGGGTSEIDERTTDVVVEAAWFDPMAIARTSKRLGLRSEASARFEKGADAGHVDRAVARFCELAVAHAGASIGARTVWRSQDFAPQPAVITLRTARVNALLGTDLDAAAIDGYLTRIGFTVDRADDDSATVVAPSWRVDVTIEEALIEEVARHYGFESIPRTLRSSPGGKGGLTRVQRERRLIRDILCGLGVNEAMTSPLVGPGDHSAVGLPEGGDKLIKADRPLALEESILRASLMPGLLRSISHNVRHRANEVWLYELGATWDRPAEIPPDPSVIDRRVSGPAGGLPHENQRLAVAIWPADAYAATDVWSVLADSLRLEKPAVANATQTVDGMHPTRTGVVIVDGNAIGAVGEVDPGVVDELGIDGRIAWLDVDLTALHAAPRRSPIARDVSRFPSSDIDLAFVVSDDVAAGDVLQTLSVAAGDLLVHSELFDVYRGTGVPEGARSLAFTLRFCALDRTLTDAEVGERRSAVIAAVETNHGATLRR